MTPDKLSDADFIKEAISIVEQASKDNVILRIIGAVAVYIRSANIPNAVDIHRKVKRLNSSSSQFTDVDFMAYGKQRKEIVNFFEKKLHFKPESRLNAFFGGTRMMYHHPENKYHVDIFFDKLEFSHDVHFGSKPGQGRLELDFPTIALEDIVLEKIQIHNINLKDIVDLIVLFAGHDVGESKARDVIDGRYIADILAKDWGFWYDAVQNLKLVKQYADKFSSEGNIRGEDHDLIIKRVDKLLKIIDETPKTKDWLKRAQKGTAKPWYREVEDVVR
ncbi:MAG: hypothetical protein QXZ70_05355 [Candidatus Bathyarchaeia archaeon]